ncbi:MFS transporter [Xenorhabdus thailandensis]|uniref:MFS transporter n=1 Tax=Xenorhabdus thailandensis TaxID=3136255 RepID=UPI0030F46B91
MSNSTMLDGRPTSSTPDHLPIVGLLALAMTGFISILTETLPAGLLPQIGAGLGVSEALAGQTVTLYALGSVLAAIPLTVATRGWRRRTLLLTAIVGFFIFNTITALSSNYTLTLIARFFAGVAAGLSWSLLAGYARRMVLPHQQGRAMAVAMVGTPIALSLGVPMGTWLGNLVGWRITFGIMSVLTLVLIVWVLFKVPDYPGQTKSQRLPLHRVFITPGVRPVLAVIVAWMLAHNILYTYISPFVVPAGLAGRVDLVLLVFGFAALAGIWIVGQIVDRWLRGAVLVSLIAFSLVSLALGLGGNSQLVIYAGVAVWGLTFGGAATLLQTALADSAGDGADVAQSMCVTAWNLAIAGGGVVGGVLLNIHGVSAFPWTLLALSLIGLLIAGGARTHGFKPGPRSHH